MSTINNAIELVNYWDSVSINVDNKASENSRDIILRRLLAIAAKESKGPVPFSLIYKKLSFEHRKIYKYEEISELIEKLQKHDLTRLSLKKPGLIEKRINDGTKELFESFESLTGNTTTD